MKRHPRACGCAAYTGTAGAAVATINLNTLTPVTTGPVGVAAHIGERARRWGSTIGLAVIFLVLTWVWLRRFGPHRRR